MSWILLTIWGEDEPEEKEETPKEPDTTNPKIHDTRLQKQVINIKGEVVTQ